MSSLQMSKEIMETNAGSQEEGLRLLARIISRVYANDIQKKTAIGAEKPVQDEQGNSGRPHK